MPYRYNSGGFRTGFKRKTTLASRQGGTGATYSGNTSLVRHSMQQTGTIQTGYAQAFNLVTFNPSDRGDPSDIDGASTKTLGNNFTAEGSRVDYVTVQLTLKQTDTSKNNTCYTGFISTSFNEGRLNSTLMDTNFKDFINSTEPAGEMDVMADEQSYTLHEYSVKDIQQHNIKGLLSPQIQLYSGRVAQMNQTIPLPRKNRRQQPGSLFALVVMNDSDPEGSDIDYRLDTFFKEIPLV